MAEPNTTTVTYAQVIKSILARNDLREHRCNFCGILAFKGYIPQGGVVQINCPRDRCDRLRRHLTAEQRFLTFASL